MNEKSFSWKRFWSDLGNRKFILLLAAGLILAMLAFPAGSPAEDEEETVPESQGAVSAATYEEELEGRLRELLSSIEGAGQVEVMVTLAA